MTDSRSPASEREPTIDENEDLFGFDEPAEPAPAPVEAELDATAGTANFADANEEAMSAVLGPAPAAPKTGAAQPTATPAPHPQATLDAAHPPVAPLPPAPNATPRPARELRGSPLLLAGLALFAVANLALIGLTWKSLSTLEQSLDVRAADATTPAEAGPDGAALAQRRAPSDVAAARLPARLEPRPEGEETLEAAREAIARGDHEGARRMLWGLLAVADRWEPARRDDLEARATLAIADAFRLQADARAAAASARAQSDHPGGQPAAESAPSEVGHR